MAKIMNVSEQVFKHVRYLNVMQFREKVPYGGHEQVSVQICDPLEDQVNDKIYIQVVQNTKLS
jgi:hypothetical protein